MRRSIALVFCITLLASPAAAQTADTAASRPSTTLFTRQDGYLAGAIVGGTLLVTLIDREVADAFADSSLQARRGLQRQAENLRNYQEKSAFVAAALMYGVGRIADKPGLADMGLHAAEALILVTGIQSAIKPVVGRRRPVASEDHDPYRFGLGKGFHDGNSRSFPSLHAGGTFAFATAVTSEVRRHWPHLTWYVAPPLYGAAVAVGMGRMYTGAHWVSDTFFGAALGIAVGAKVVRYNHAHPGNRVDDWLLGVAPAADGGQRVTLYEYRFGGPAREGEGR